MLQNKLDLVKQLEMIGDVNTIEKEIFFNNLRQNLNLNGQTITDLYDESNEVEKRILYEYGAVFLTKATPPNKVMFTSDAEVDEFQSKTESCISVIDGSVIELQTSAMDSLSTAIYEAASQSLSITPRDGEEAGKRSYNKTLTLWNSRFEPALLHWESKGLLSKKQINKLVSTPIKQQVTEVLKLEEKGIYFNTFFNNSILYSVAAPGTSQHLSMLAFDVSEFRDAKVREILAANGWFRTVQNDEPHFTYLGYAEKELPDLGLQKVNRNGDEFWIPNL